MTTQRIILHCGVDKTGSTSIRASLARNLADPKFRYVAPGMENASRCLSAAFKDDPSTFHYFRKLGLTSQDTERLRSDARDELIRQLDEGSDRTLVLSAEAVSAFKEGELRRVRDFLLQFGRTVTAIAYIRRPKEYMESNLQQRIKRLYARVLPVNVPDYRARFERFDQVFGRDNVQFVLFDPKSFVGGDVVLDFCARSGISFDSDRVIRANEGLSLPALALLFAYGRHGPPTIHSAGAMAGNHLLVARLRKLVGTKLRLHSSLVRPVLDGRRAVIDWMESRLGVSMQEDLAVHDAVAIRSESDLLRFSPASLEWLAQQLGPGYAERWRREMSAEEVADWVHKLCEILRANR